MARPTLSTHPKFFRLASLVGGRGVARGALELIWDAAYASGDPNIGDAISVEAVADWRGKAGKLTDALVSSGFLDAVQADASGKHLHTFAVHDLEDHAPDYVLQRWQRESDRRAAGETIRSLRQRAAKIRWEAAADASDRRLLTSVAPPAPAPNPDRVCLAPARDPSGTVPRTETITGSMLTQLYGRTRAQLWPNALEWVGAPASPEKAANMAASIPPDALEDVKKTMLVMLTRVKAGEHRKSAEIAKSPGFGFAVWCAEFHELFEEVRGKTPAVPPNGTRGSPHRPPRDQITGYAEPPPAGTQYPSGKVQLR